ncbi:MAG TPA: PilZ domain-containing protein [Chloroflexota bacterium]
MALQRSVVFESGMAATIELNGLVDSYASRIEQVRGDVLVVDTPMRQREYVALGQGQRVLLQVTRRHNPYFYETVVVGTEWSDGQQQTLLRRPADNAGVQLRRHVRVTVSIADAQYWIEGEEGKFGPTVPGSVLDISAGGLLAMTKEGLPEGAVVLTKFTLSRQAGNLMASVKILRNYERVSDLGVKTFRSHCQFVDLPERERDRLIKFVFQRERELRAKGQL